MLIKGIYNIVYMSLYSICSYIMKIILRHRKL